MDIYSIAYEYSQKYKEGTTWGDTDYPWWAGLLAEKDEELTRLKAENEKLLKLVRDRDDWYGEKEKSDNEISRLSASLARAHEAIAKMNVCDCPYSTYYGSEKHDKNCNIVIATEALADKDGTLALERWKAMEAVVEAARYLVKELEAPHQSIAHLVDTDDNAGQYLREALEALDAKGEME